MRRDRLEASLWYNEDNPQDKPRAVEGIQQALRITAEEGNLVIGEIEWEDLSPEDGRLPEPPFTGHPRCLVGRAEVLAEIPFEAGMSKDLDEESLLKLREATRRAYRKRFPQHAELTDAECDDLIDRLGPDVAVKTLGLN